MICSECCTIVSEGKFCPNCGAPLKGDGFDEQSFPSFDFESSLTDGIDGSFAADAVGESYAAGAASTTSSPYAAGAASAAGASYATGTAGFTSDSYAASSPYATNSSGAPYAAGAPYATNNPNTANASGTSYTTGAPYNAGAPYSPYTATRTTAGYPPYTGGRKAPAAALVLVIVGLALSLTGILTFPGLICSVIGLALNSSYNRKGLVNERKTATFVIGLIGLIMGILISVVLAAGLVLAVNTTENGDFDVETYLEELLDEDADLSDESKVPSIVYSEGRDADDEDDAGAADASDNGATANRPNGGVAGRISGEGDDADAVGLSEAQQAFVGKWKLTKMLDEGRGTGNIVELLDDLGMKASLVLKEDGVAKFTIFEQESYVGTWEIIGPTSATLTIDGDSASLTINDGTLELLADNGDVLYFEKK